MNKKLAARLQKLGLALTFTVLPINSIFGQATSPNEPQLNSSSNLTSPETGVNYAPLQALLSQQEWRKANDMTGQLMLEATNRQSQGWVATQNIEKFPCWDLAQIDSLWKQYSNGHFGFSVQFPIFIETGNRPGRLVASEAYDAFGDAVGWREPNPNPPERGPRNQWIIFRGNLKYNLASPLGHLPNPRSEYQITGGRLEYTTLTKRLL
ncbi:MAG: GUN4 domain-containing protein, partial [Snowella sp.]